MRVTHVLFRQHIGRMFKKHWRTQGHRFPIDSGSEAKLNEIGIPVYKPEEILQEQKPVLERVEILGYLPKVQPRDETHPLWHDEPCYMYTHNSALLEGIDQAKGLTKTVELRPGLPPEIESLIDAERLPDQDKLVQRCVMMSHIFDPVQLKLPKVINPDRPAYNYPRTYGLPDYRVNESITHKFLQLCESVSSKYSRAQKRFVLNDAAFSVLLRKDGELVLFDVKPDLLLMANEPLVPLADAAAMERTHEKALPDLYPMKPTITLEEQNIYDPDVFFPVTQQSLCPYVHTVVIHFNKTKVKNKHGTPVTEQQFLGRTLGHTFAIAAAQARRIHGDDVKHLPDPVVIQSIQTDGKYFHFAVLQLNTLDLDGEDGLKNILWMTPRIPLFETCTYNVGRPELVGYSPEVFKRWLAFYVNGL